MFDCDEDGLDGKIIQLYYNFTICDQRSRNPVSPDAERCNEGRY